MTDPLRTLLLAHVARYPQMECRDLVKLLYQNVFGGGHLIRDIPACKAYLRREYESVAHDPSQPLWDAIGNGLVRVHLAAVKPERLDALADCFIRSAAVHTGTLEAFLQKLDVLHRLTLDGQMPFSAQALEAYLQAYAAAGYPMVSHSEAYRQAYHPAYRVVLQSLL